VKGESKVAGTLSDKIGAMHERLASRAAEAKRKQYNASRAALEARRAERDDDPTATPADEPNEKPTAPARRR
jgi:hypothetical protein